MSPIINNDVNVVALSPALSLPTYDAVEGSYSESPTQNIRPAITETPFGAFTGQCKWWSNRLNYGFITVLGPADRGLDLFCHHTGIKPLNSKYRTLRKGEYCNFDIVEGLKGRQAVRVTGIGGGPLMCDVSPYIPRQMTPQVSQQMSGPQTIQAPQTFAVNWPKRNVGYRANANTGYTQ